MKAIKNLSFLTIAVLLFASVNLTSCGKYEEGPSLSLRSKKARVANEWVVEKIAFNGTDITDLLGGSTVTYNIKKDGTWEMTQDGDKEEGTWEFNDSKEELVVKYKDAPNESEKMENH